MNFKELDPEIIESIASVGGQYGKRIEQCIFKLKRLRKIEKYLKRRVLRSYKPPMFTIKIMKRVRKEIIETKGEALKYRYYLIIYRESLGLVNHKPVFEIYNIEQL